MRVGQRRNIVGIGVVVLATLGVGVFFGIKASQGPTTTATVGGTIELDGRIREAFVPVPLDAAPKLTAEQAFARHRRLRGARVISVPAGLTVKLGLLTWPTGEKELVWGYSWHFCPMSRNPKVAGRVPGPCTRWEFLDASTGREVDEAWQQ